MEASATVKRRAAATEDTVMGVAGVREVEDAEVEEEEAAAMLFNDGGVDEMLLLGTTPSVGRVN